MANRFWIGVTTDANSTGNWSTTSGGGGGASVPTSSDAIFFNSNSNANNCVMTVALSCASLDCTGWTKNFNSAGFTLTCAGALNFNGTGAVALGGSILNISGNTTFAS